MSKKLTKKVNERLPDGSVSEEFVGRWLRDAFQESSAATGRLTPTEAGSAVQQPEGNGKAAVLARIAHRVITHAAEPRRPAGTAAILPFAVVSTAAAVR